MAPPLSTSYPRVQPADLALPLRTTATASPAPQSPSLPPKNLTANQDDELLLRALIWERPGGVAEIAMKSVSPPLQLRDLGQVPWPLSPLPCILTR